MKQDLFFTFVKYTTFIRRIIYRTLGLLSPSSAPQIVVFSYHTISDDARFGISKENFKAQINYIVEHLQPLKLSDLAAFLKGEKQIDKPSFVLTFDDGYQDNLEIAPFLKEKGINPAVFVLAESNDIDRKQLANDKLMLTDDEILKLHEYGWEIGAHSATHADFTKLDEKKAEYEIKHAKQNLIQRLNIPIKYFSYPKGYYNEQIIKMVKESGYELALSMDDRVITDKTDKYKIPRIGVDSTHKFSEFKVLYNPAVISFRNFIKHKLVGV
jgi:peptidoglycan/xylan/chitin deacetylase (PgdA/CDA1 family)